MEELAKGDPVTVLHGRRFFGGPPTRVERGTICGFEEWSEGTYLAYTRDRAPPGMRRVSHEGISWARGHTGPAVDALLVAEALR